MMKNRSIFEFDFILPLSAIALIIIGILFIYSSGISSTGVNFSNEYIRQIIWASIGLVMMVGFTFLDYSKLKNISNYIYALFIFLLILTLLFGQVVNGAKSWLSFGFIGIQPSEFSKLATILFLARYLENSKKMENSFLRFTIASIIGFLPMGLILIQPDMGTAMVFFPIAIVMMYMAGIRLRYLIFISLLAFTTVILTVLPAWETFIVGERIRSLQFLISPDLFIYTIAITAAILLIALAGYIFIKQKYYYWLSYFGFLTLSSLLASIVGKEVLKEYQLKRLIVFIDPGVDPRGAGWNVIQSITAVGSGGAMGKGYLQGTQSHYRFLPQQSTDFIFSIISEEWGFLGCSIIFGIFLVILIRSLMIISYSKDTFGLYIGMGIIAMIFFHFIVNIGMAMGIMPITGIPLIFLSYGGSALWTGLLGISLIMNIYSHRYKY